LQDFNKKIKQKKGVNAMIDINDKNFGLKIKKLLLELGITQRNLAKQLKITDAYLSDILKGNRKALDIRQRLVFIINNNIEKDKKKRTKIAKY